jgi:hypothetical protein
MRFGFNVARGIGAILVSAAVAAACSAGGGGKNGPGGTGTGASSNTGGSPVINTGGTIGTIVGGGSGGSDGNPMLVTCSKTSDCDKSSVCVLTPSGGLCSPNGGTCTAAGNECVNDTYCCLSIDGCMIEGVTEPTCVSNATHPVNEMCKNSATVGLFSPDLQCEWTAPEAGDPFPTSIHVLTTPLVANLPTESGTAGEIVIVTSDGGADATLGGRIRILNGQTCKQIEVISAGMPVRDAATPAIADLDGDGKMEIVTRLNAAQGGNGGLVAFKFNGTKYDVMWTAPAAGDPGKQAWDGISIHDIDDDGKPEIIGRGGEVNNGQTGAVIAAANPAIFLISDPVVGDVDGDHKAELVANKVFRWSGKAWAEAYPGLGVTAATDAPAFYGFADFGTRSAAGKFDPTKKDGRAEVVGVGPIGGNEASGVVRIYTLEGEPLLNNVMPPGAKCSGGLALGERGGPPTIGDFDGDGMPELASAGAFAYRVFDLGCATAGNCKDAAKSILWESPTQDCTSGMTGSTIFDFEGDGTAEAIYADECFVRVYNGKTGEVLFSTYRNSATWWEQPIVADPDNSDRSKIIFGGAPLFNVYSQCGNPAAARNCEATGRVSAGCVDPLWAGVRCAANDECVSGSCVEGFCRCTTDAECGNTFMATVQNPNDQLSGLACHTPLAGTPGTGNVCRAEFGNITTIAEANKWFAGVKVYRDKLDRWASSRNLWNQHAYSITNINDDGSIPKTSEWKQNFQDPALNNYRQNRQGATSQDLADITGALDATTACTQTADGKVIFTGRVCNRGLRGIGSNMPAAFYLGEDRAMPLCQTETPAPVAKGGCQNIQCTIPKTDVPTGSTITMIVNDVGGGNRLVDECNYENNTAQVKVEKCEVVK